MPQTVLEDVLARLSNVQQVRRSDWEACCPLNPEEHRVRVVRFRDGEVHVLCLGTLQGLDQERRCRKRALLDALGLDDEYLRRDIDPDFDAKIEVHIQSPLR